MIISSENDIRNLKDTSTHSFIFYLLCHSDHLCLFAWCYSIIPSVLVLCLLLSKQMTKWVIFSV